VPEAASPISPPARVTVIGLGNMGRPMAACIARGGYAVTGFDLSQDARARFEADGGRTAPDMAQAVADAAVVITLLPNGKIVRAAVEQMRPHLRPDAVIVDMSSSDPLGTRKLGEELAAAGFAFLDAPVSGGVKKAAEGTLAIMVGGDAAAIDRVAPVLQTMGKSIFRTGPLGSGHAVKALNNYVSAAGLVAAIEALHVGKAFGIDPNVIVDVLNASTGRNNSTENKLKQFVISESYASGFALDLMAKDIRTADDLAAAIGVPVPLADKTAELWDKAAAALGPGADHTAIDRFLRSR
jgi:3-hydroxyisobutyrate dehydrogenase